MQPDVSVVIPTRNRRDYLGRAIASCFEDNGVGVEVVVVDDGGTDGTREWLDGLADPRIRIRSQAHQGAQAARNRGLDAATGRYLKFLDDDDWLLPGTLERQVRVLAESGAELVAGDALVWREGEVVDRYPAPRGTDPFIDVVSGDATTHPLKYTMTRELAASVRWDTAVEIRTDLAFMLEVSRAAVGYRWVDGPAGCFRVHAGPRLSRPSRDFQGAAMHLELLGRTAEAILEEGTTPARAEAVRLGLWRWLHLMHPRDPTAARRAWRLLQRVDHATPFRPPRDGPILRALDRLIGPMAVEELTRVPRLIKRRLRP